MKFKLRNGKEAVIRKKLNDDSFVAYYSGEEGESLFLVHRDEIDKGTAFPYIFWDNDGKKKKRGAKNNG